MESMPVVGRSEGTTLSGSTKVAVLGGGIGQSGTGRERRTRTGGSTNGDGEGGEGCGGDGAGEGRRREANTARPMIELQGVLAVRYRP
jgi:hypothetical protein